VLPLYFILLMKFLLNSYLKVLYDYESNLLLKMKVFGYNIMKNVNVDR
jgi:hypothetical protein